MISGRCCGGSFIAEAVEFDDPRQAGRSGLGASGYGALRGLGGERTPEDGGVGGSIKLTFTGNKRSVVVPSPSWPGFLPPWCLAFRQEGKDGSDKNLKSYILIKFLNYFRQSKSCILFISTYGCRIACRRANRQGLRCHRESFRFAMIDRTVSAYVCFVLCLRKCRVH